MTQPGHRLHNLNEMQLMSQNAAQRAATRTQVLETTLIALQKRVEQAEKHLLGILDALQQQQEAERQIAEAHEGLTTRLQALENPPKRKPGRPKGLQTCQEPFVSLGNLPFCLLLLLHGVQNA